MMRFVAYLRVATDTQSIPGLGMEAQAVTFARHLEASRSELIGRYVEVESG